MRVQVERREAGSPAIGSSKLKLKRILLPVDFSKCSRKALEYAVSFARQFQAELLLLHVIENVYPPPELMVLDSAALDNRVRDVAERQLAAWRKEILEVPARGVIRSGVAHHEIVAAAEDSNIDLIILGTHGRRGMAHLFLGSTAERVVRRAPCPVMVVREREHDFLAAPRKTRSVRPARQRR
jgi:universal stress protein A